MKYRIEFHNNQDIISIHVTLPLSNSNTPYYTKYDSSPVPALFAEILRIPGVVDVNRKNKYEMSITKGSAFEWDEIIEKAMDTVGLLLSPDVPPERGPDMRYYIDAQGYHVNLKEGEKPPENIVRKQSGPLGLEDWPDF